MPPPPDQLVNTTVAVPPVPTTPMTDIYNFFSSPEIIFLSSAITFVVLVASFYREVIKGVFEQLYEWINNIRALFKEVQMIPGIIKRIDALQNRDEETKKSLTNLGQMGTTIQDELNNLQVELVNKFKPIVESNTKKISELLEKMNTVEGELSTNSGKSIKDLIMKIAEHSNKTMETMQSLDFEVKRIEARQWNIMVNTSETPMFETDKRGLALKANRAYLELVGMPMEDVKNNGWINIIHVDDRKLVQYEWDSSIDDERAFDLKFKIQNNTTNRVYSVRCIATPVLVENALVGYIGRYINIVEMVQDEKTNFWVVKPR